MRLVKRNRRVKVRRQFESLVTQQAVASNRVWDAPTVKDLMARNYIDRWIEEPLLLEVQKGSSWI